MKEPTKEELKELKEMIERIYDVKIEKMEGMMTCGRFKFRAKSNRK